MSWTYRIGKTRRTIGDVTEEYLGICEVYVDDNGLIEGWTDNDIPPGGETPEELRRDLLHMLQALEHPVVDLDALRAGHDSGQPLRIGDWSP